MLDEANHDVTVIDWDIRAFRRLPNTFSGTTFMGNGVDEDILRAAGIEGADVFVATTSGDNRNVMASQIAKQVFEVPKIISRIKDPIRAEIYRDLGYDVDCRTTRGADAVLALLEPES